MRTTNRDQRGPALAACCAWIVIALFAQPAAALYAEYSILHNGTAFNASVELSGADRFDFFEIGVLGERVPQKVTGITLSGNCSPCTFTENRNSAIMFPKGNYTIRYTAPLKDYHLQAAFERPYRVNVFIPEGFDVSNPLLAGISPGGVIRKMPDNTTSVQWNRTNSVDLRFYERSRENLLYLFGNFWLIIAVVLLVPFLLTMRKRAP